RHHDAARALAALEEQNADSAWAFRFGSRHPFVIPVNRLAAGRWLLAAGDTAQAARLLSVYNVDLPGTLQPLPAASVVLGVHMLPELARIEEAHEHAERAQRY